VPHFGFVSTASFSSQEGIHYGLCVFLARKDFQLRKVFMLKIDSTFLINWNRHKTNNRNTEMEITKGSAPESFDDQF
jgi:hypothetical protein